MACPVAVAQARGFVGAASQLLHLEASDGASLVAGLARQALAAMQELLRLALVAAVQRILQVMFEAGASGASSSAALQAGTWLLRALAQEAPPLIAGEGANDNNSSSNNNSNNSNNNSNSSNNNNNSNAALQEAGPVVRQVLREGGALRALLCAAEVRPEDQELAESAVAAAAELHGLGSASAAWSPAQQAQLLRLLQPSAAAVRAGMKLLHRSLRSARSPNGPPGLKEEAPVAGGGGGGGSFSSARRGCSSSAAKRGTQPPSASQNLAAQLGSGTSFSVSPMAMGEQPGRARRQLISSVLGALRAHAAHRGVLLSGLALLPDLLSPGQQQQQGLGAATNFPELRRASEAAAVGGPAAEPTEAWSKAASSKAKKAAKVDSAKAFAAAGGCSWLLAAIHLHRQLISDPSPVLFMWIIFLAPA
ncbi:unnamed protein product [Polarella glacialis]|uniref:Uncharacterized protein n=1 Tax=Polarella glacialis TaxID=89957 RepID=A0A813FH67_POLGL|nr:unnamed protein product [Polarella glacialis]